MESSEKVERYWEIEQRDPDAAEIWEMTLSSKPLK
jgi:hypothetical protein